MAFSGALTLTDLNDFITPSQACIKPVEQVGGRDDENKDGAAASTEIRIDVNGAYYEVPSKDNSSVLTAKTTEETGNSNGRRLEQAQVSLNDCLACSGCITSAESVLITLQSHTEVLNFLESNASISPSSKQKIPVVSIAPQTLASLAASLSFKAAQGSTPRLQPHITPRQVLRRLRVFCKEVLGFHYVFDTTLARHISLKEHVDEFLERRESHRQRTRSSSGDMTEPPRLPMLASACPGWICYAEKAHPEMLPFISSTKSPQQIMGTLVKEWMGRKWGKTPEEIYHVSVMPCYDKKLEASRSDFYNDVYSTRDVDCVITTGELERLVQEKDFDLTLPVSGELDAPSIPTLPYLKTQPVSDYSLPELLRHPGSSSGSYLQTIIDHIIASSEDPLEVTVKQIRNADYEEVVLRRPGKEREGGTSEGEVVFKGAKCYGFRNLQNVVRKVGKESGVRTGVGAAGRLAGKAAGIRRVARRGVAGGEGENTSSGGGYDYIEVMACPGGCVNGGGQLKPPSGMLLDEEGFKRDWASNGALIESASDARWGNREWNKQVEEAYWHDLPTPNGESAQSGEIHLAGQSPLTRQMTRITDRLTIDIAKELSGKASDASSGPFRTQYRAVESEVIGLAVKW